MFEQVLATTDFTMFSALMATRNIMIQEQVLAMILASTGALPTCLTRDTPTAAGTGMHRSKKSPSYVIIGGMDDKEEKELMQLVMQYVVHLFAMYFYTCSVTATDKLLFIIF